MAKTIQLTIQTAADLKGIRDVQKALADIAKGGGGNATAATAKQAQAYTKLQQAAAQVAQAEAKKATATSNAATADARAATAAQNLATAQARTATATAQAAAAQTRAAQAALRFAQAQDRAAQAATRANSGMAVLPRTIAGLSHEAAAFATASLSMGAAVGVATAAVSSFAQAFQFKAQLDATTLAINAQLKGVRDQGQVWSEASAFAQKFKLTQEETTNAIAASIGVMRASKAPMEDILGVLARMQVLSPEQSLQEAAIALKALASGDTTSLVTRFEVGRDVANQMKQEIQGGADAVAVMGEFLGGIGIGMDVLAAKTTGAAGAIKDLAIAQEQLKLAQAEFAQGPGMAILQGQIQATRGLTRVLSGDFTTMGAAVRQAAEKGSFGFQLFNTILGGSLTKLATATTAAEAHAVAQQSATVAVAAHTAGQAAYNAAIAAGLPPVEAAAAFQAAYAQQMAQGAAITTESAAATDAATSALLGESAAAADATTAIQAHDQTLTSDAAASQLATVQSEELALKKEALAQAAQIAAQNLLASGAAGAYAAAKLANSSNLVDQLTAAYYRLAVAQAAAAQAKTNAAALSEQRAGERDAGSGRTAAQITWEADQDRKAQASRVRRAQEAESAIKKARGGGASAAAAAGTKLEALEQKTGDKMIEIDAATQQKLIDIDRKAAEERARIATELTAKMAQASADRRASQEADDLDLIGVTDAQAAQKLNDRERAQAAAREREVAAAKEAQNMIANGEAEAAAKVYETRQKQIDDQQALDEKYAERQRELAEDPAALEALKTQYDEATRAIEEQAATRIAIEKAAVAEKQAAVQAEKDAVVAAAEDQKNQVVSKAQQSAAGVMKASGDARAKAVSDLKAIGDAVNAIPSQKTINVSVTGSGASAAATGGGNKAAGGGTFLSHGPTQLTVGDNPGGMELVTVTPISGKGQTKVGNGLLKMAGGGAVVVDAGDGYTTPVAGGPVAKPGKGKKGKGGGAPTPASAEDQRKAIRESIEIIKLQNELRNVQAEAARLRPMPINYAWIEGLAIEAQEITRIVTSKLLPLKKDEAEAFGKYASATGQAADVLKTIAELRTMQAKAKEERPGPIIEAYIVGLANEAQQMTQIVRDRLIPSTELESELYASYADAVGSATSVLKDVADLRKVQAEATTAHGMEPNREAWYIGLADEAVRVARIVSARAVPAAEEEREKLSSFNDIVGSSVGILKDVSGLTSDMFADYHSPTDAQLGRLVTDADRVTQAMTVAAARYDTKGLEAAKAYTDALGGTFGVIKDGLLAFEAINSGDFVLDKGKLAQFTDASMLALDVTRGLAAKAAAVPASDLASLQAVTAAVSGQAEALIKLAAVPFGNLSSVTQGYAQSGGAMGGSIVTNYNTFTLPTGTTQQLANEVIRILNLQAGGRR